MKNSSLTHGTNNSRKDYKKTPTFLDIEIPNFEKYNPRSDGKNRTWIRLQNALWTDSVFNSLPMNARGVFMSLICHAGDRNRARTWIGVGLKAASIGLKPGVYWACTGLLAGMDFIVIHAESFNSALALSVSTDGRTNERTDGSTKKEDLLRNEEQTFKEDFPPVDEEIIQQKKPTKFELQNHPAMIMETRMVPEFSEFENLLKESGLDSPEILSKAPLIFQRFENSIDRFVRWTDEFKVSKRFKEVRGKSDAERRRTFKIALLGECGMLTPRNERKP